MYKVLSDGTDELTSTHDMNGVILSVSPRCAAMLGYTPREMTGRSWREFLTRDMDFSFTEYLNTMAEDETATGIFKVQHVDGNSMVWFYKNMRIDEPGEASFVSCTSVDVAERAVIEKQLQSANKISDMNMRRLHKALAELEKAKKLAEESARIKDEFLANMSHEIRTPMNAILGFTGLLQEQQMSPEQEEFVEIIKTSGQNLLVIINDILDFSKIESGKMTLESTDFSLRTVQELVLSSMRPRLLEKNLELVIETDPNIPDDLLGDPVRFNQILMNLLSNAIKFTEHGQIALRSRVILNDVSACTIQFEVSDTGIGIQEGKLDYIFESFTQASSSTTRKFGGTGLGLAIVKRLVELHGGHITVSSKPSIGSSFVFTLPYKKPASRVKTGPGLSNGKKSGGIEGLRVLLAEDNLMNQKLVMRLLKSHSCECQVVENGHKAIEKLLTNPFDIVLMDIQMPEMDGYEATRIIRQDIKSAIPIIAFSAHAIVSEREKCLSLGMNDYVSKPFNPEELVSKMQALTAERAIA
ncbi:MAG: ATP-binding protein [Bacteroidota bacterium]